MNRRRAIRPFLPSPLPLLLLPLLGPLGSGAPSSAPAPGNVDERVLVLSLEDALRIAVESNLDLEAEEVTTESAEFDALGSWGAFDPTLSVRGTLSKQEQEGTSSLAGASVLEEDRQSLSTSLVAPLTTGGSVSLSFDRTNYNTNNQFASFDTSTTDVLTASITQPLLKGSWRRFATTRQRESEVVWQRQREHETEVRNRLLLDVYHAYWDLVSAIEELGVRELAVELGEHQLLQDRRRLEVGAGTEVDVLQAQTNVAQQEETRIQAEFALRAAEDALRRLLFQKPKGEIGAFLDGWDWPINPTTRLPELGAESAGNFDWRRSLQEAVDSRPELEQVRLQVNAAEIALRRARSEKKPQLDLELAATGVGFDTDPSEAFQSAGTFEFPEYRGSLVFSLPLRNRAASFAERAARATLRNAHLAYDVAELNILAEVRTAVRDVRYRRESVLAAKTSLELARRRLAAEEARYENGLSTTFQVLEFQKDLAETHSSERAARAAHAKALAQLRHSEGALPVRPCAVEEGGAGGEAMREGDAEEDPEEDPEENEG
jgi:outer membrane protein